MLSAVLVSGLGSSYGVPDGMQLMMLPHYEGDWDAVHLAYLQDQTITKQCILVLPCVISTDMPMFWWFLILCAKRLSLG